MNSICVVVIITLLLVDLTKQQEWETSEITAYNFHTYFFQIDEESVKEALTFREYIQELSDTVLVGCRVSDVYYDPVGPHVIGQFETCCNSSALGQAQSFFMYNRGNLSILQHALTRWEVLDYTVRTMWLGKDMPVNTASLREDLGANYDTEAKCLPITSNVGGNIGGGADFIIPSVGNMFLILLGYFVIVQKSV